MTAGVESLSTNADTSATTNTIMVKPAGMRKDVKSHRKDESQYAFRSTPDTTYQISERVKGGGSGVGREFMCIPRRRTQLIFGE